jgi:hypothetical protein
MEVAAHAAPDGATLAIGNSGTHIMNAGLQEAAVRSGTRLRAREPVDLQRHGPRRLSENRA